MPMRWDPVLMKVVPYDAPESPPKPAPAPAQDSVVPVVQDAPEVRRPGRPPIHGEKMTKAEYQRRYRARQKEKKNV